ERRGREEREEREKRERGTERREREREREREKREKRENRERGKATYTQNIEQSSNFGVGKGCSEPLLILTREKLFNSYTYITSWIPKIPKVRKGIYTI